MIKLDKVARDTLKKFYNTFESVSTIHVSSPDYSKTLIDYYIKHGLLEKIDASSISNWAYIIRPTYDGELLVKELSNLKSSKVEAFIEQGELIMREEYHHVTQPGIIMPDYISGPKSDQWFSEISILNSRALKGHPLHDQIEELCKKHRKMSRPHEDMMGYLRALLADDELDADIEPIGNVPSTTIVKEKNTVGENNMKKKYQVFISSTYEDLVEERAAVSQCLLDCGCIPVGMEQFPASGMSQMAYIKKMLADCDYYILILAGRYGSIDTDGIGFTEKEYDYAKSIGLPVMSFVIKAEDQLQSYKCENTDDGRRMLKAFRSKVCGDTLVKFYENKDDLRANVAISLQQCIHDFPAVGWVRATASDSNDAVAEQVKAYLENLAKPSGARVRVEPNESGGNTLVIS